MTTLGFGSSNWLESALSPATFPLGNHTPTEVTGNQSCSRDDEIFKYHAYTVTYLLVFPIGFLTNSGALLVLLLLTPKRSASTIFMINLALSDTFFSLTLPLRLAYYFKGAQWDQPDWLCRLCVFCFYLNLYTSVLFLTGLSVLRWLAVVKPLHHRALATPLRASLTCLCIWLFVGVASVPFLFSGTKFREGKTRCFEPMNNASWKRIFTLNYVAVTFGFLIPFVTILSCYGSIIRRLTGLTGTLCGNQLASPEIRTHNRGRLRRRRRSLHLVALVICTFLLCFLPYHVARSLHLQAMVSKWGCPVTKSLQRVLVVTLCLAAANSVMNPMLYYYAGESFRKSLRRASIPRSLSSSFRHSNTTFSRVTWRMKHPTPTPPVPPLALPLTQ